MSAELCLWQTVLSVGLLDAAHGAPSWMAYGNSGAQEVMDRRARSWIGSKGFREVCDLSGFCPDFIEEAFHAGKFDNPRWFVAEYRGRGGRKQAYQQETGR